jgi:hypothetical protein
MNRARIALVVAFALWSLLLFGGSGLVGWIGDGLAQLLTNIHLGWLGTIAAGLGKALIFIIWLFSAMIFSILFAMTGQLRAAVQASQRRAQSQPGESAEEATVTLERGPDGSFR